MAPQTNIREPAQDLRRFEADELLRDGGSIHIRAIRPDDKDRLRDHFDHLSSQSVYFRFFGVKRRLTDAELVRFTEVDFRRHVGLVATLRDGGGEHIIGVGRYIIRDDQGAPARAEVAFAVDDAHQGRGIGTVLLDHLARVAQAQGVTEFEADVLGENNRMLDVFRHSGFVIKRSLEGGVVHVTFPTQETAEHSQASAQRERISAAESVRPFLRPASVAVVGASARPGAIGFALIDNLKRQGFAGPLYAVNPAHTEVAGVACYPNLTAIGAPVELVIIAVPAAAVEEVVAECARAGVRGIVVISAGFAESSAAGRETEHRLTAFVRQSGMRMVGPNCMGVLNTDPSVRLNATFAPTWPPEGNIAMVSQSGALGIAMLDQAARLNLGLSAFISVGNKADVSSNDLLSYWAEEDRTQVIILYLESFGNPQRFSRLAPQIARRKPIIAVKSGRSSAGRRAAASHSAALASVDVAVDALFEQTGVIRCNTLEDLFDVAALLATQPLPPGPRIAVVTNAGGPGILLADACEAQGLALPELTDDSRVALRQFLPAQASIANPVDMIASATPEQFERTIGVVGTDPNVDALTVIYIPPIAVPPDAIATAIARGAATVPPEKPVLCVFMSSRGAPALLSSSPRGRLPSYSFPENAAQALGAAHRYAQWRKRPRGAVLTLDRFAETAVRAVIDRLRAAGSTSPQWLPTADLSTILRAAGIDVATAECVSPTDVIAAADRLGYPLVAKVVSPDVLHKSDVGGVILDLDSPAAVAQAAETLVGRMQAAGARLDGILLQRHVREGVEAFVGVTTDPTFGPLLVCGLGGVLVELLQDVSFRLPPVTDVDAEEMLAKLRAGRLLEGYRGSPPADRKGFIELIMRVSAIAEIVPELRELDLNPVKVLAPGRGAIVVDGRMRID